MSNEKTNNIDPIFEQILKPLCGDKSLFKTYQPHPAYMMQECMEEQGDYVLRDDAFEVIDTLRAKIEALEREKSAMKDHS